MVRALADLIDDLPGVVRVAIDGPRCAHPDDLAQGVADLLRARGRRCEHVRADGFWHDRSLRFEYGREDVEGYLSWLDAGALRREVLDAVTGARHYLPALRDPVTNRSTRTEPVPIDDTTVVLVSGALLLGLGLPFERTVHLLLSPAARARRTPEDETWTLPAFDSYDAMVDPGALVDVVIRADDPRHPAVRGL